MKGALPVLLSNVDTYRGPHVPVRGLRGLVYGKGLKSAEVQVIGIRVDERGGMVFSAVLGLLTPDVDGVVFDARAYDFICANRVGGDREPIDVWVK